MWAENYSSKIFNRVALLGTGLMGGSLGMAIRERSLAAKVVGYDQDLKTCRIALERGAIDCLAEEPEKAVAGADLVVLAVPVKLCGELLRQCSSALTPGTIVTDLGSTKLFISEEVKWYLPPGVVFIGGHPMTGSEDSGIDAADPTIWENAIYVLTPDEQVPTEKIKKVQTLVEKIGAQPLLLTPEEHDHIVALVSHLPHLVAVALVNVAANHEQDELVKTLAAGGFRDTTRVAMGNPEMWKDIFITNREAIEFFLDLYLKELEKMRQALRKGEEDKLEEKLVTSRMFRRNIPYRSRGILPELFDIVVLVKDTPGVIGKIATSLGEKEINIAEVEILHVREEEGGSIRFGFSQKEQRDRALQVLKEQGYRVHRR